MMVVVAGHVPDVVGEEVVLADDQVGELLEHGGRHLVLGERQLEDVAREHERRGAPSPRSLR